MEKTIDEILKLLRIENLDEVTNEGTPSYYFGSEYIVTEEVADFKKALVEWVRSKKPDHPQYHPEGNAQENGEAMGYDTYEEALLADLEANDE